MKEYIFTLIGAALISSVVGLLLPEGAAGSKYVKLVAALCVLGALAAPIADISCEDMSGIFDPIIDGADEKNDAEDRYFGTLTELGAEELKKRLTELLCEKFSIDPADIEVGVEAEERDGSFAVTRVTVGLFRAAILRDPYKIEEYVQSLVDADCDVYY